jgi:ABC-2 type transport system permease protein
MSATFNTTVNTSVDTTVSPAAARAARRGVPRPVPFSRLLGVEWRKQLDTRAGRWVLITIAILTAAVLAVMASVDGGNRTFAELLVGTVTPMALLLPVVGILAATAEWSQRTGLVTFTLEPRRTRVGLAKLLAALGTGAAFFAVAVGLAALTHVAVVAFRDVEPHWAVEAAPLWGGLLLVLLSMAQGVAFGALLLNTPAAIVTYFVLPTVFGVAGSLITALEDVLPWIDLGTAGEPLLFGEMTGAGWGQLASASAIWVLAPLVAGLVRVARAEIRSA